MADRAKENSLLAVSFQLTTSLRAALHIHVGKSYNRLYLSYPVEVYIRAMKINDY